MGTNHKTPYGHARSGRWGGHRNATCVVPYVCRDTNEAPHARHEFKRVCTHARAAACTIRAAAVAKMGRLETAGIRVGDAVRIETALAALDARVTRVEGGLKRVVGARET